MAVEFNLRELHHQPYITAWVGSWLILVGCFISAISIFFLDNADDNSAWCLMMGVIVITVGAGLYTIQSFIAQPVLITLGATILTIGLTMYTFSLIWETHDRATNKNIDNADDYKVNFRHRAALNVAAMLLIIVAIICFVKKAIDRMIRPYFGPANYFLHGSLLFGAGAICFLFQNLSDLKNVNEDNFKIHQDVLKLGALFLVVGSFNIMIATARFFYALDLLTVHNYPSIVIFRCSPRDAVLHVAASLLLVLGASVFFMGQFTSGDNRLKVQCAAAVLVASGFILQSVTIAITGDGNRKIKKNLTLLFGSCLLAFSYVAYAVAMGIRPHYHESSDQDGDAAGRFQYSSDLLTVAATVGMIGSTVVCVWSFGYSSWPPFNPGSLFFVSSVIGTAGQFCLFLHWLQVRRAESNGHNDCATACEGTEEKAFALLWWGYVTLFFFNYILLDVASIEHYSPGGILESIFNPASTIDDYEHIPRNVGLLEAIEKSNLPVEDTEVLVVGCGPSGLTLAIELGQRDTKVISIEKREKVILDSRFFNLVGPTVDGMKRIGILDNILKRSTPQDFGHGSTFSTGLLQEDAIKLGKLTGVSREQATEQGIDLTDWDASVAHSSYQADQFNQRCMQSTQEYCLKEAADENENIDVRYGWELVEFEDSGDVVYAKIQQSSESNTSAPEVRYIKSRFLIGCDGPGSIVSKRLGAKFDGFANLGQTRTLHFRSPGLIEKVRPILGDALQYQVVRPGYGVGWFVYNSHDLDLWTLFLVGLNDGRMPRQIAKEEVPGILREFVGPGVDIEVVSDGTWFWNLFFARRLVYNNVMLVGDSAHSWPPFGGIGGNTGYGDANNLGWKLAAVVKGWATRDILESYDLERTLAGLRTIMTVLNFAPDRNAMLRVIKLVQSRGLWWTFTHRWSFGNAGVHSANHFASEGLQYGLHLKSNIILKSEDHQGIAPVENSTIKCRPDMVAGGRLPMIRFPDGRSINDRVAFDGYTLFLVNPDKVDVVDALSTMRETLAEAGNQNKALSIQEAMTVLFRQRNIPLTVVDISGDVSNIIATGTPRHQAMGELYSKTSVILARPDFYICWFLAVSVPEISVIDLEHVARVSCAEVFHKKEMAQAHSSMKWLRQRFIDTVQGYRVTHKHAIYFENEDKNDVMSMISKKTKVNLSAKELTSKAAVNEKSKDDQGFVDRPPDNKAYSALGKMEVDIPSEKEV